MRTTWITTALVGTLLLAGTAWGKGKPAPMTCPDDPALELATACPCDGRPNPAGVVTPWKNHGQYVSCVVRLRNALRKAGCLDDEAKRTIARCAARSTCGKADRQLCCTPAETGVCSDPAPGDLVAAGTCSNDPALVCDVDNDCTKSVMSIVRDEALCAAAGGFIAGAGSLCSVCPAPPPPPPPAP